MQTFLVLLISLLWGMGTLVRIYKQARFYQIDEYKSNRYLRWLFTERERWLALRPLAAWGIGSLLAFFTDSIPTGFSLMPYIFCIIAALVAIMPPDEGEIKKKFVRTQRAMRILATAFSLALLLLFGLIAALYGRIAESDRLLAVTTASLGFLVFWLAPLCLMLGNHLMSPVEAALRQRFINEAKGVLKAVNPKIIGITGSYGKTTTKNYLRDILNGRYKTYATPKSYNTLMGICIALNNDVANDYSIDYFISEMGAYVEGEIKRICELTPPDISIVVDVGPQHLERFGSLENVAKAKYEIIEQLSPQGLGIFNWDNPYVREMYERGYPENRIAVSKNLDMQNLPPNPPRFIASEMQEHLNGLNFMLHDLKTGESQFIETPLVGEHNVMNLLLATAVAVHEGMSLRDIALRARTLAPAESRLVVKTGEAGITIINDAYSANPVGVRSALKVLGMYQTGKRLLITPGMVELGELHEAENRKLGEFASEYATDVILVGEKQTAPIKEGLLACGFPVERLQVVSVLSEAIAWYKNHLQTGDAVLFLNDLPDTY